MGIQHTTHTTTLLDIPRIRNSQLFNFCCDSRFPNYAQSKAIPRKGVQLSLDTMDSLFLFCFRSCLRGDEEDRVAYYRCLDVDPTASQEAIKKSFKKKSLSIHPDKLAQRGIELTAEHKHEFQRLKEAHEVLTDPKRKKLYDQLGESGLQLMENPNPVTLIKNFQKHKADQCSIVLLLAFLVGCLFILPILFVLKCDSTLGPASPWVAIWTPMWLVDFILLMMAIFLFIQKDEESMEEDENGKPIPLDDENKIPMTTKILNFVTIVLLVLIQLFVTIRLDGYTSWNWFAVFAPWFIFESIQIVMHAITAFSTVPMPDYSSLKPVSVGVGGPIDDDDENDAEEYKMKRAHMGAEYYGELYEQTQARNGVATHLLRVWLAVFLALQANKDVRWNWGLVLLPIWVHIFKQYVFAGILRSWGLNIMSTIGAGGVIGEVAEDDAESGMKRTVGQSIANSYVTTILGTLPLSFMAILLVCRLQEGVFTTFVIILPVFLVLSCGCCALFCGLFFIVNADTDEMSRRLGDPGGGGPR